MGLFKSDVLSTLVKERSDLVNTVPVFPLTDCTGDPGVSSSTQLLSTLASAWDKT
jgi:hypothetical protein